MLHGWKRIHAGQKHRNRLRAIAKYWSEIVIFSYPLHLTPPVGGVPIGIPEKVGLPGSEDSLTIG